MRYLYKRKEGDGDFVNIPLLSKMHSSNKLGDFYGKFIEKNWKKERESFVVSDKDECVPIFKNYQMYTQTVRFYCLIAILPSFVLCCLPGYKKELRYLKHYLGIEPKDDGKIANEGIAFNHYIDASSRLNCRFSEHCAWENAHTDGLLDTSDFYVFSKTDKKTFPIQVQHGSLDPPVGSLFALAGNTTFEAQRAVLVSAPVACQRTEARLSFNYWLYNGARIEILLLKPNTKRRRLQLLFRPLMDCHALKPQGEACVVKLPPMNEPFRIGIRAFNLKDPSLGGFAMISDINYDADICIESAKWSEFGGRPVPPPLKRDEPQHASEYSCVDFDITCRWSNSLSSPSEWRIGRNLLKWKEYFTLDSTPVGSFFYQYVDETVERPYSQLRSELIPCTLGPTSLSLRFWLQTHTQVQICTESASNVVISCIYLNENDSPGPIVVDVDAPSEEAFRFVIEMINFDELHGGLVVIDDIRFDGLLCHETTVAPPTTINLRTAAALFDLRRPKERLHMNSALQPPILDCDFEENFCPQWQTDENWGYGMTPQAGFNLPKSIEGNIAVAVLKGAKEAILRSLPFSCANGKLSVQFYCSEKAKLKLCVEDECITAKKRSGFLSIALISNKTLHVEIRASSDSPAITIVRRIHTDGHFCPLLTLPQVTCEVLKCTFNDTLCSYANKVLNKNDSSFEFKEGQPGLTSVLDENAIRAVLESPKFETDDPVELEIEVMLSTFGSQFYICNEAFDNLDRCNLLLGPKVMMPQIEKVRFRLDQDVRQIHLVAYHDKFIQFGPATFSIISVNVYSNSDKLIC